MPYIKHSDTSGIISSLFEEIEREQDPFTRSKYLSTTMNEISRRLTASMQRVCLELFVSGTQTDVIADSLGISQRAVKRLISKHAAVAGIPNPLIRQEIGAFIDIRSLVDSRHATVVVEEPQPAP